MLRMGKTEQADGKCFSCRSDTQRPGYPPSSDNSVSLIAHHEVSPQLTKVPRGSLCICLVHCVTEVENSWEAAHQERRWIWKVSLLCCVRRLYVRSLGDLG